MAQATDTPVVHVGSPAPDGKGTCAISEPIEGVPEEHLWTILMHKAYHPELYIGVSDVMTKDNPDGSIWRVMYFGGKGTGKGVIENITVDKQSGIITFTVLDEANSPTGALHFNILHRNPYRIEYSQCGPDGRKTPLSNGNPIRRQILEARLLTQGRSLEEVVGRA